MNRSGLGSRLSATASLPRSAASSALGAVFHAIAASRAPALRAGKTLRDPVNGNRPK